MRFPSPLMSFALSGLTLPLLLLLWGWQRIQQQVPLCQPDASWWWGDAQLPTLDGDIDVNN